LRSGIRNDSLFLGIHFGMTRKEFYDRCLQLNHDSLLTNGPTKYKILYKIQDTVGLIEMHFYPDFEKDKIYQMPMLVNYENWAPWNRKMQPDSLQQRIKQMFDKWYGPGFIKVKKDSADFAFVKVDGNRRITIYRETESEVKVLFTDLLIEAEIKKNKK
jgi:hypothetical protein